MGDAVKPLRRYLNLNKEICEELFEIGRLTYVFCQLKKGHKEDHEFTHRWHDV